MSNAEKILEKYTNGGWELDEHEMVMVAEVLQAMQAHTNQTLQELKEKVESMDKGTKLSELVFKEDVITLIDEAINE